MGLFSKRKQPVKPIISLEDLDILLKLAGYNNGHEELFGEVAGQAEKIDGQAGVAREKKILKAGNLRVEAVGLLAKTKDAKLVLAKFGKSSISLHLDRKF